MSRAEKHVLQTSLVRQVSDFRPFFAHPLLTVTTATSASTAPFPAICLRVLRSTLNTIVPHSASLRGERPPAQFLVRYCLFYTSLATLVWADSGGRHFALDCAVCLLLAASILFLRGHHIAFCLSALFSGIYATAKVGRGHLQQGFPRFFQKLLLTGSKNFSKVGD